MSEHEHAWPSDRNEHLWGPWLPKDRNTHFRTCVHPCCRAVEERQAPKA